MTSNLGSSDGERSNIGFGNQERTGDDDKALKAYYLEHLENNTMSDKGGAGLGFITIGMKSGNKLKTNFKKINNEFSLFILKATISIIKETV